MGDFFFQNNFFFTPSIFLFFFAKKVLCLKCKFMFISNHVVKSVMGKQTLQKYETYDTRLIGKTYYWRDSYGNTYTHYLERQQDGKFYGEFYNKRTRKNTRTIARKLTITRTSTIPIPRTITRTRQLHI